MFVTDGACAACMPHHAAVYTETCGGGCGRHHSGCHEEAGNWLVWDFAAALHCARHAVRAAGQK